MTKDQLRMEILERIYGDYAEEEEFLGHKLMPDWYLRYRTLSKLIVEYLNTPDKTEA